MAGFTATERIALSQKMQQTLPEVPAVSEPDQAQCLNTLRRHVCFHQVTHLTAYNRARSNTDKFVHRILSRDTTIRPAPIAYLPVRLDYSRASALVRMTFAEGLFCYMAFKPSAKAMILHLLSASPEPLFSSLQAVHDVC